MNLLPLLVSVIELFPDVPVLAAGGIGSGRALAAVLGAGADGAWVGTAFVATEECVEVNDEYKRLIVASDGEDTVFTRAYDIVSGAPWPTGIGERVRRNAFTDEWHQRDAEVASKTRRTRARNRSGRRRRSPRDSVWTGRRLRSRSARRSRRRARNQRRRRAVVAGMFATHVVLTGCRLRRDRPL